MTIIVVMYSVDSLIREYEELVRFRNRSRK